MAAKPKKPDLKLFAGILIGLACAIAVIAVLRLDTTGQRGSGLGADFEYNLDQLAKIDPNLILYEESAGPINTGFTETHAIAIDTQEQIYIAGDTSVKVFSDSGAMIDEIELEDAPMSLAVETEKVAGDDSENLIIYIGLKDHVEVYNNRGELLNKWDSLGDDAILMSIAAARDDVFVADAGNRVVLRYDKSGNIIKRIGLKDTNRNIDGFIIPSPYFDLALGRDGLLRVVNPGVHRIETYTFNGDLELWWGEFSNNIEGFCGCCNPVNFAILPGPDTSGADDSFITCEKGLTRVKVYDSKGTFIGVVAGPEQLIEGGKVEICDTPEECQMGGFDVAIGLDGRIFVLDTIKNVVRIFSLI